MASGRGSSFDLQRSDIAPGSADFYWVNQQNQAEIVDEYVRASVDTVWHHDLTKLTPGDVIFHNYEGEVIGYSLVESLAETYTVRDEEYYRVSVELYQLPDPIPVDKELKRELGREDRRTEQYYPVDKNYDLTQTYLSELSGAAVDFLLSQFRARPLPAVDVDGQTNQFLTWSVEKYHQETDWEGILTKFDRTASLVEALVDACLDADTLGSLELKIICDATNVKLNPETLRSNIRDSALPEATKERLDDVVPEEFGIVGGQAFGVDVTDDGEVALLNAFETLRDDTASEGELLDAVDAIAAADTEGVQAGKMTPVLSLLNPTLFPINNGRTRTVMTEYFGFDITSSLSNYRREIPRYMAVRDQFGFKQHFRNLDWYCHWLLEVDESGLRDRLDQGDIGDRTVWQINIGEPDTADVDDLWPIWRADELCSLARVSDGDSQVSHSPPNENDERATGDATEAFRVFSEEIEPGQLLIAKDGFDVLGIGVTLPGGYHHCNEYLATETGVDHPYVWPVAWVVTLGEELRDSQQWDLSSGLTPDATLAETRAFEELRGALTRADSAVTSDLAELERVIDDPPSTNLPDPCSREPAIGPAGQYETVSETMDDIFERVQADSTIENWLAGEITGTVLEDWSAHLSPIAVQTTVTPTAAVRLEQIRSLFATTEDRLASQASQLGSGTLDQLSEAETLFMAFLRDLQRQHGIRENVNQVKLKTILHDEYTVESPDDDPPTPKPESVDHPVLTHLDTDTDATVYKFTAPPDFWLTAIEYRGLLVEDSHAAKRERVAPGDMAILHSQQQPTNGALNDQPGVVFGVGIFGETSLKDQEWLPEEQRADKKFSHVIGFDRLFITSDIDAIDFATGNREKSHSTLNDEVTALTRNGLSIDRVQELCREASDIEFPTQNTFVTFRSDDDSRDLDRPRAIISALAPNLTELPPINHEKSFSGTLPADELLDGLHFPGDLGETIIEQIEAALLAGDNIILTGPPGTGKTEIVERVATYLADSYPHLYTGSELTTATADWSTFDTVGGYMPTETSSDNADGDLAFTPGIILNRLKDTQTGVQSNEPVIIDELNRADIDKAFGQLFTLLSGQSVQLPFTRNNREIELLTTDHLDGLPAEHQYVVPDSWRIFATMNTYDKTSLYEMSYAFMRRFAFIRVPAPEFSTKDDDTARHELTSEMDAYIDAWDGLEPSDEERDAIGQVWKQTNQAVEDRSIGPAIVRDMLAYVTNRHTSAVDDLSERVTEAVISYIFPQLEGVPERKQIITHIATVDATDSDALRTAASDMLQVTIDTETES